jgi:molybdopterin synthase sulfur carrier subunit
MIRVLLPHHLRTLAQVSKEIELQIEGLATIDAVLETLENRYPMLRGTIRDQVTLQRRPFIRFFACGEDWSLEPSNIPLPEAIAKGQELFRIVGAMAGG